jgi:hypothetical protein
MEWKTVVKWGLVLGVLVVIWQFVMGFTGWYAHPVLANAFLLVVLIDVVVVVLALRETRKSQGYSRQVLTGVLVGVVGSVLVLGGSLLFTTVAFPEYFETMASMQETVMAQRGYPPETVQAVAARTRAATPLQAALQGVVGTIATSLVVALLAAIGYRRKPGTAVDEKWSA